MVTKDRNEELKQWGDQRGQPSWWGNDTQRSWRVQFEVGSPYQRPTLKDADNMFRGNFDTRKTKVIYRSLHTILLGLLTE
jgi:hypothetical protein